MCKRKHADRPCHDCPWVLDDLTPEEVFVRFPEMDVDARRAFLYAYEDRLQRVTEILVTQGILTGERD